MAHTDQNRPTTRPSAMLGNPSIQPVSLPLESDSPPSDAASEDFLYHLSRGSELLKENLVEEAREAVELALRFQPQDLHGQGLLGVVYFRLGLYPRAIDIYRQIVEAFDEEIAPKVNLALCYVKTGQHQAARDLLEDVVRRDADHPRAFAYLGLVYQFQRDFSKACAAFERAGQPAMAERMRQMAIHREPTEQETMITPERWELRAAAQEAFGELETNTTPFRADPSIQRIERSDLGRWRATEPGEDPLPPPERPALRPSTPPPEHRPDSFVPPPLPPLSAMDLPARSTSSPPTRVMGAPPVAAVEHATSARLSLPDWLEHRELIDSRTIRVDLAEPFAVRATAILLVSPIDTATREIRMACRAPSGDADEPLGGAQAPIIGFFGPGQLMARVTQGTVDVIRLVEDGITVRQSSLFGLSLNLAVELERCWLGRSDYMDYVRITGRGTVALQLSCPPITVEVSTGGLVARVEDLIGWTSSVSMEVLDPAEAPGRVRGFVSFRGQGRVILGG